MNSIEIKNKIKKIIQNRIISDPSSDTFLHQIANFIYHAPHDISDSLRLARNELKSQVLYDRLESHLADMIAENIYATVSSK
jgi:hypothetical protein